ncbi:MAG: 16S rRNA (uracil(1498)-N(3))-methyltransferase [Treponema sp.]|jgi:16S rRNA (uracil1498-N3)-methyltransferase|nr:16S rRNA (uracil(1498)-N(3))-methyltransferase [Treponema sp.]
MKQFLLRFYPDSNGRIHLGGKDYHYLVRVRRLKRGAVFKALLPDGKEVKVRVESAGGSFIGLALLACPPPGSGKAVDSPQNAGKFAASLPAGAAGRPLSLEDKIVLPPIALFQAMPKHSKFDLILRQAVEGGISEVQPFFSEYSVPRIKSDRYGPLSAGEGALPGGDDRIERQRRIIREALQQSGSPIVTNLRPACSFEGLVGYWEELRHRYPGALGVVMHQEQLEQGSLHAYLSSMPEFVALAVGPEGGFSSREIACFLSAGFKPLHIKDTVLRVETAALYGAASIRIILLESSSWIPKTTQ